MADEPVTLNQVYNAVRDLKIDLQDQMDRRFTDQSTLISNLATNAVSVQVYANDKVHTAKDIAELKETIKDLAEGRRSLHVAIFAAVAGAVASGFLGGVLPLLLRK